jgi:hypothetical protein
MCVRIFLATTAEVDAGICIEAELSCLQMWMLPAKNERRRDALRGKRTGKR